MSKKNKTFNQKMRHFSMQYLAHHPLCFKFNNHVFRIGSLYLCVGCFSVLLGFIISSIIFFVFRSFFETFPIILASIGLFGVCISLLQLLLKPEVKLLKFLFRLVLGIALGAYTGILILVPKIWLSILLFLLLIPGVYLSNILRGPSPYKECETCSVMFVELTCDYFISDVEK
ncbi:MAG: hypothetical protein ACFFDS_05730 [Candidatus Thorarchaeota archaeon]